MSRGDDLVGTWVDTPTGAGQVWAVAGCRHDGQDDGPPVRIQVTPRVSMMFGQGRSKCSARCVCPPAVWVADGSQWHLIRLADLRRTPIGATA